MINEVLKGITDALYAAFGDNYEIHTEASMQDMEEPAFLCAASIRMCREGLPAAEKQHCFLSCSIFRKATSQRKRSIPFTNG